MNEPMTTELASIRAVVMRELEVRPAPRPWRMIAGGLVILQIAVAGAIGIAWSLLFSAPLTVGWQTVAVAVAVVAATVAAVRPDAGPTLRASSALSVAVAVVGAAL